MFRRDLAGRVLEPPRRVGHEGGVSTASEAVEEIGRGIDGGDTIEHDYPSNLTITNVPIAAVMSFEQSKNITTFIVIQALSDNAKAPTFRLNTSERHLLVRSHLNAYMNVQLKFPACSRTLNMTTGYQEVCHD